MVYYNPEDVAKRIKETRLAFNMKQSELAERLGLSETQIYRIENGKYGHAIDVIVELAQVFKVSADYLLFGKQITRNYDTGYVDRLEIIIKDKSEKEMAYAVEVLNSILSHTHMLFE